ncbi:MAG: hypothetical protein U0586_11135 [Candidatus Brocadiaceae bacterium]
MKKLWKKVLHKLDIPTRHEFQQLQKKLDEVIKKLESKEEEGEGSSRKRRRISLKYVWGIDKLNIWEFQTIM